MNRPRGRGDFGDAPLPAPPLPLFEVRNNPPSIPLPPLAALPSPDGPMKFDGGTYRPEADLPRLRGQVLRVFDLMKDGRWRTLEEIAAPAAASEASVSARLRDLRKPRFGGHEVQRRPRGAREAGLFEYRLLVTAQPRSPA
jgi:hypothetical protein